jgi:hypothetical protein
MGYVHHNRQDDHDYDHDDHGENDSGWERLRHTLSGLVGHTGGVAASRVFRLLRAEAAYSSEELLKRLPTDHGRMRLAIERVVVRIALSTNSGTLTTGIVSRLFVGDSGCSVTTLWHGGARRTAPDE